MAIYLLNSIICPFYNWMLEFMLGGLYCALLSTAFMQMTAEVVVECFEVWEGLIVYTKKSRINISIWATAHLPLP